MLLQRKILAMELRLTQGKNTEFIRKIDTRRIAREVTIRTSHKVVIIVAIIQLKLTTSIMKFNTLLLTTCTQKRKVTKVKWI